MSENKEEFKGEDLSKSESTTQKADQTKEKKFIEIDKDNVSLDAKLKELNEKRY